MALTQSSTDPFDASIGHQKPMFPIVDCDSHLTEPPDLWTSRVAGSLKSKVPVQATVDGVTGWYLDGELWAGTGGNVVAEGYEKRFGDFQIHPFEKIHPAAWHVGERVKMMDDLGIAAQVLYPNGIGFSSNHIAAIDDPETQRLVLTIYNDFLVDVQRESGGRLLPQAILPFWDMKFTVSEMERLLAEGITGFTLSDKPEEIGLPSLDDPYFDPMWGLFNESKTVTAFHINGGRSKAEQVAIRMQRPQRAGSLIWGGFGVQRSMALYAVIGFMSNVRVVANLCMSNLFDRFPQLTVVSAESGIGWIPFMLEAMEYQFDEMVRSESELALTKRRPREYFRDHVYVMFWFEQVGVRKLLDDVGGNNVLVETDFPHPVCLFPEIGQYFNRQLEGVDEKTCRAVLHDNAARIYGLDPLP